jgi:hypothetical protein
MPLHRWSYNLLCFKKSGYMLCQVTFNNQSPTFTFVLWKLFCVFLFVYIVHVHVLHSYPLNVCSCFRRRLLTSAPIYCLFIFLTKLWSIRCRMTDKQMCLFNSRVNSISVLIFAQKTWNPSLHLHISLFKTFVRDFMTFTLFCVVQQHIYNPILLLFCFVVSSTFATYIMKSY